MAQHVVVPRRPIGEFRKVQRRDLQGTGRLEAGDGSGVRSGRFVGADLGAPAGYLAIAVEHVLVRERHAGERPLGAAFGDRGIGGLGGGQGLVGLQRDDAMRQLVAGLQAINRGLGRLDAGHLLVADGLRQAPRGESGQIGHGLAPSVRARRKSSTSAPNGSSSAIRPAVRDSNAACALAAARRSGGMSR